MLVSLYDVISYDVINVKNFREIWGTSFKFWLCPWGPQEVMHTMEWAEECDFPFIFDSSFSLLFDIPLTFLILQ